MKVAINEPHISFLWEPQHVKKVAKIHPLMAKCSRCHPWNMLELLQQQQVDKNVNRHLDAAEMEQKN